MALDTVANYLSSARTLLQDNTVPYRYSDAELVDALNIAVFEGRRLRPDLFLGRFDALPTYSSSSTSTAVVIDEQFRPAFLYYMVGHAQLRDEEDTQDARASGFLTKFERKLLVLG